MECRVVSGANCERVHARTRGSSMLDRVSDGVHEGGEYQTTHCRMGAERCETSAEVVVCCQAAAMWPTANADDPARPDDEDDCIGI